MSEFLIHHEINELVKLFGAKNISPEVLLEKVSKTPKRRSDQRIFISQALSEISKASGRPEEFLRLYRELESRNVSNLCAIMSIINRISTDKKLKSSLEKHALEKPSMTLDGNDSSSINNTNNKTIEYLSSEAILELKYQLKHDHEALLPKGVRQEKKAKSSKVDLISAEWVHTRKFLTWDFVTDHDMAPSFGKIGCIPKVSQENYILDDLLYLFAGINSEFMQMSPIDHPHGERSFVIDETMDRPLQEQLKRILPMCVKYSYIVRFAEEKSLFEAGQVAHALSAAIGTLLEQYMIMVAQLEDQHRRRELTLQKVWYYIQPSMNTLSVLHTVASGINKGKHYGGQILTFLHEKLHSVSNDGKAQKIYMYLAERASVPYMSILGKWIYKGIICDHFKEFLVGDNNERDTFDELNKEYYSDDYWAARYSIQKDQLPVFLKASCEKILRAGKYLNVIRQCGEAIQHPPCEDLVYSMNEASYVKAIDNAYNFASKTLMKLLCESNDLMGRLWSVKKYYLMEQGDFIVQFIDLCGSELDNKIAIINENRLESLLEVALRLSTANNDNYKDDVRVLLLPYDLESQLLKIASIQTKEEIDLSKDNMALPGWESFTFNYLVTWPVSLVLNMKLMSCYQMLFRHLFFGKYVEKQLCSVWINNSVLKSSRRMNHRTHSRAFALRHKMKSFIRDVEFYMMVEVLEPSWLNFMEKMKIVTNVDQVLECHNDFLNTCLKDCMMTNPELLRLVKKLFKCCLKFSRYMQNIDDPCKNVEANGQMKSGGKQNVKMELAAVQETDEQAQVEDYNITIKKFDSSFTSMLTSLLEQITYISKEIYSDKLVNLLYRLDYNKFYFRERC